MKESADGSVYAMPATPLQLRLWELERQSGPNPAWNIAVRFRLAGPLDRERLEGSLERLVACHEALRTSLVLYRNALVQRISPRVPLAIEWCDLRGLDPEEQTAEILRLSREHARQPLALAAAPLLRVRVLRLAAEEHLLLWNTHHAICDGWSIGLMAQQLMEFYGELAGGSEPVLQNALDYGDYSVWLDAERRAPGYESHRRYWTGRLSSRKPAALPDSWRNATAVPPPPEIHSRLLPRELTDPLAALAQRHGTTFFHAALAVFSLLLRAYQSAPEVSIGTPWSGRDQAELEGVVGAFVNYIPLCLRLHAEATGSALLLSIRDEVTEAMEHAGFRSEDMLSGPGSDPLPDAEARLFSAVFICQQDFVRSATAAGLTLTAVPSVSPGALHALTVFMVERPDGWRLSCEVDNRSVSVAAGSALLDRFERLLAALVAEPGDSLAAIAARAGLVLEGAQPEAPAIEPPGAVQKPARRWPVRVAATEFQRRFWQLERLNPGAAAFHIRIRLELTGALDVPALEGAVAALADRHEILRTTLEEQDGSLWQVIHPELAVDFRRLVSPRLAPDTQRSADERLANQAILDEESRAQFSLTAGPLYRVRLLELEDERHWLAITLSHAVADGWSAGLFLEQLGQEYERRVAGAGSETPAITVRQFADYAEDEARLLAGSEKERRLAWWRGYLEGVWTPLALPRDFDGEQLGDGDIRAGLEVSPLSSDAVLEARRFARECQTTLFAVFGALFQALLARYSGQEKILFLTPHANRTDNTETTLGPLADPLCLTGRVEPGTSFRELVTRFSEQSMDAMDQALPLHTVTPLVDMRVAGGYHPLSQITFFYQRAFVHDMEWKGLRVQSLPDLPAVAGSEWQLGIVERQGGIALEFLYDATLYSRRTIQTAARHFSRLLTRAIAEPEKALSTLPILTAEELALPAADAPAIVRCLLPLSGGNPAESRSTERMRSGEAAPPAVLVPMAETTLSATGITIRRIWQQLFQLDELAADSNFFDLGGHSLLLARLQIAIKKEFNIQLTAAEVFRHPTIASLAEWLDKAGRAAAAPHNPRIIPIQLSGAGRPIFVISQSMIFRTLAAEIGYDQPVYAIQMLEQDTARMSTASFEQFVDFYVRLIREVQPTGPYRIAGWCVSGWIAYGVARSLEKLGASIELLMIIDSWAPGYWANQPPLRRRLMLAVYELQRSRWIARRLREASPAGQSTAFERGFGKLALAARKVAARFQSPTPPANAQQAEEQARGAHMQKIAAEAAFSGPLEGTALLFRSEEEPRGPLLACDMGWGRLLGQSAEVEELPGDHQQIFDLPGARMMAVRARHLLGLGNSPSSGDRSVAAAPKSGAAPAAPLVEA